jgi:hypothetical protein
MHSNSDDYDDFSMDDDSISDLPSIISDKIKHGRDFCAICGAKPSGINFDVLTVNKNIYELFLKLFIYLVFIMQSILSTKWC